jgi:deoxyribodipyrimidine photo-lyase
MERITRCSACEVNGAGEYVLYWMTAYRRRHFNFALERAVFWATELRKPLVIFEGLACRYPWANTRIHTFVLQGMRDNLKQFKGAPVSYFPFVERSPGEGREVLSRFGRRACVIVTDDFPAFEIPKWISIAADRFPVLFEKVDSNGIFPMRATDRLFVTAHSFRTFLAKQPARIAPLADPLDGIDLPRIKSLRIPSVDLSFVPDVIDKAVEPVSSIEGGGSHARAQLQTFLSGNSESSGLSPYLHFGHISSHEVYQRVLASRQPYRERFLDQLVTWRELGFNMCALSPIYDRYESLPQWAQNTLAKHSSDPRPILYTAEQLETASTHDQLWNTAQMELLNTGSIRNRLRMLWGKKILEWSATTQEALEIMIHLNNKYALDGRDPNSYSGIFWILGRYDRPWGPERPIFGLVRYMSSESTAKKLRASVNA